ncbi:PRC-barrel domain containing protein [Sphingopyxis sp. LARHCG72]|jgi:hypothetical protein
MRNLFLPLVPLALVAACTDKNDAAEDKMERTAEKSAIAAGPAPVALGLSEAQLLDAELIGSDGTELGDVAAVIKDAGGKVDRLLVEIEDSHPDRFVHVPVAGLKTLVRGDDTDLSTPMTKAELAALPEVKLPAP